MLKKFLKRSFYRLIRRVFVKNFNRYHSGHLSKRALVYYKTEGLFSKSFRDDPSHTNQWESFEVVCILNKLGFVVDVIDRTASLKDIEKIRDEYDIFVGLGAGGSGRYFSLITEKIPKAVSVLYAMGPEPSIGAKATKDRHNYFRKRHPDIPISDRRVIEGVNLDSLYDNVDAIITIGEGFCPDSYRATGKRVHKIYLSTHPSLRVSLDDFKAKSTKKFFYFGGNGNVAKGLDLVLEVFAQRPDLELFIGAPETEEDFNVFSEPIIRKSKNIHRLGFIDIRGLLFKKVSRECGYVILPAASEGSATSVITCMRRGLVPVVTLEVSIENVDKLGFVVREGSVEAVAETVDKAANIAQEDFKWRSLATYLESFKYTRANFSESLEKALINILKDNNLF